MHFIFFTSANNSLDKKGRWSWHTSQGTSITGSQSSSCQADGNSLWDKDLCVDPWGWIINYIENQWPHRLPGKGAMYWKLYREAWDENWVRQTISPTGSSGTCCRTRARISNVLLAVEKFSPLMFSPQHWEAFLIYLPSWFTAFRACRILELS